jgi:hypothetical protein
VVAVDVQERTMNELHCKTNSCARNTHYRWRWRRCRTITISVYINAWNFCVVFFYSRLL